MKFTKISQINFKIHPPFLQPPKKNFEITYKFPFLTKSATSLLYSKHFWTASFFLQVGCFLRAKCAFAKRARVAPKQAPQYSKFMQIFTAFMPYSIGFLALLVVPNVACFIKILLFRQRESSCIPISSVFFSPKFTYFHPFVATKSKRPLPRAGKRAQGKGCIVYCFIIFYIREKIRGS
jgi:hypothetical protein